MSVYRVIATDRTFFVATSDAAAARELIQVNHPEIDPAEITVTEEPPPSLPDCDA
jgi:hypothetical protein